MAIGLETFGSYAGGIRSEWQRAVARTVWCRSGLRQDESAERAGVGRPASDWSERLGFGSRRAELSADLPSKEGATPDALRTRLKASIDKWMPAVKAAGMKPE